MAELWGQVGPLAADLIARQPWLRSSPSNQNLSHALKGTQRTTHQADLRGDEARCHSLRNPRAGMTRGDTVVRVRVRGIARWVGLLALVVVQVGIGLWLWLPAGDPPNRESDLGGAIIGGAVVALAVLLLDWAATRRSESDQLRLTLNLDRETEGIRLDRRDLGGMYLVRRNFACATFRGTRLRDSVLYRSILAGADLSGADLRGADAGRVVLNRAQLAGAQLAGCDLGWADLRGADLSGVRGLGMAKLLCAVYDRDTVWPALFDPAAAGAVHEGQVRQLDTGPEGYVLGGWSDRRPAH